MRKENERVINAYDYLGNAASTTDCTGLVQAGEGTIEELEKYQEIYKFGAQKINTKKQCKKKN